MAKISRYEAPLWPADQKRYVWPADDASDELKAEVAKHNKRYLRIRCRKVLHTSWKYFLNHILEFILICIGLATLFFTIF